MNNNSIHEDVFEAIRKLEGTSPVIILKDNESGYLRKNRHFELMGIPDGTMQDMVIQKASKLNFNAKKKTIEKQKQDKGCKKKSLGEKFS